MVRNQVLGETRALAAARHEQLSRRACAFTHFFWVSGVGRGEASLAYRGEQPSDFLAATGPSGLAAAGPCFVLFFWVFKLFEVSEHHGDDRD